MVDGPAEKLNFILASVGKQRAVQGGRQGAGKDLSSDRKQDARKDRKREGEERTLARAVTEPEKAGRDGVRHQKRG